jgi:catechol 2,3-dioxygenase-like lactoylglutathione lyase family enzyme
MKLLDGVNVVSLTVTDLARARRFYAETLGLGEPWFDDEAMGWVEWGAEGSNGNVAVTLPRDGSSPGGGTTPVFNTEDGQALFAELQGRGVRCEEPVAIPGLLTYVTFYDPDGNRLQAISGAPQD